MGWHSEKQFSSLTIGEQQIERDKVNNGYHSQYFNDIIKERTKESCDDKKSEFNKR